MATPTYGEHSIPSGYVSGLRRCPDAKIAHLYKGTFQDPGYPMCLRGWTNPDRSGYSIFRNLHLSDMLLICDVCLRRAREGKEPVDPREDHD